MKSANGIATACASGTHHDAQFYKRSKSMKSYQKYVKVCESIKNMQMHAEVCK